MGGGGEGTVESELNTGLGEEMREKEGMKGT